MVQRYLIIHVPNVNLSSYVFVSVRSVLSQTVAKTLVCFFFHLLLPKESEKRLTFGWFTLWFDCRHDSPLLAFCHAQRTATIKPRYGLDSSPSGGGRGRENFLCSSPTATAALAFSSFVHPVVDNNRQKCNKWKFFLLLFRFERLNLP